MGADERFNMATLVIPGALQVSLHFEISGQETVNVLGFSSTEIMPAETAANRVHDAWTATGGPMQWLPTAMKLLRVKATELNAVDSPVFERASTAVGGQATAPANLATCAVVRVGAGTRSRSGKGRVYFGPLGANFVQADGRTLNTTMSTNITTAFNTFRTTLEGQALTWSVLSRKLSTATPVQSVQVASIIGTQRRRLR